MTIDYVLLNDLLSVEQVQPGRCSPDVWEHGTQVMVLAGPRSWVIERWVREVAKRSQLAVDWSFFGGRAVIQAVLKDNVEQERLAYAIGDLLPTLQEATRRTCEWELQTDWSTRPRQV